MLLKLSKSDNVNEASNALIFAQRLIEKHGITAEELEEIAEKAPAYGDDELLYTSPVMISWKMQLAFAISSKFDCMVVQEEVVPVDGNGEFQYYIYGSPDMVLAIKQVFESIITQIYNLVVERCVDKDEDYIESYQEGLVAGIKQHLEDFISRVAIIRTDVTDKPAESLGVKPTDLAQIPVVKEKPTEKKTIIKAGKGLNVIAYFTGVGDGKVLGIEDVQSIERVLLQLNVED